MRTDTRRILLIVLYGFLTLSVYTGALILLYRQVLAGNCFPLPPSFRLLDVCTLPAAWVPFGVASLAGAILLTTLFGYLVVRMLQRSVRTSRAAYKEFAETLAHELRTPLTILTTRTEIQLLDATIEASDREAHERTLEELSRINTIITKALTTVHNTNRT